MKDTTAANTIAVKIMIDFLLNFILITFDLMVIEIIDDHKIKRKVL